MTNLKPCPFCGKPATRHHGYETLVYCQNAECVDVSYEAETPEHTAEVWNCRPGEDAAWNAALEAAANAVAFSISLGDLHQTNPEGVREAFAALRRPT